MNIIEINSDAEFISKSVKYIADAISSKPSSNIALSGGSTPVPIYESLGKIVNFEKVNFYQVDERYICKSNKYSNFRMINETLYRNHKNTLIHFDTSLNIKDCLQQYSDKLNNLPNLSFDLTILGIGPDGHIASLFPNTFYQNEKALCINTQTEVFDVKERLSISPKLIMNSKKILILLKGENKKNILDQLPHTKNIEDYPVMMLKNHPDTTIHFSK